VHCCRRDCGRLRGGSGLRDISIGADIVTGLQVAAEDIDISKVSHVLPWLWQTSSPYTVSTLLSAAVVLGFFAFLLRRVVLAGLGEQ
jgi:hypothetical protein